MSGGIFFRLPALLVTLPSGHLADRFHRARLFCVCVLAQAVVGVVLYVSTREDIATRELLLAAAGVIGALRPVQLAAQQASLHTLIPPGLLARALAVNSAGGQSATIAGPALAGLLFAGGVHVVYACCLAAQITAALFCTFVRVRHGPTAREPLSMQSLLAGVSLIWNNKTLLAAVSLDLVAMVLGGATALLPIYAEEILHVGPQGLGLLRSAPALGALPMAVILSRWPVQQRPERKLLGGVAAWGACMTVFGFSTSFILSMGALALSGAADMVSTVIRQTLVQIETPHEKRGRVAAVDTLFVGSGNQLGDFESGIAAAAPGPVPAVVGGGLATIAVAVLWGRMFPGLRLRPVVC